MPKANSLLLCAAALLLLGCRSILTSDNVPDGPGCEHADHLTHR